jgi:mannose-6-phosphate isomerase-like protein (cupin superfamily)
MPDDIAKRIKRTTRSRSDRIAERVNNIQLNRTGVIIRIQAVAGTQGNTIEGTVKPHALEFSQTFTEGEWNHEVVDGTAEISQVNTENTLKKGERLKIHANQKFAFKNKSTQPWRFKAHHPMWQPYTFFYEFRGQRIPGSDMWFELKGSPDEDVKRPMYNIQPSDDQRGTFALAVVDPGSETLTQYNTDGANAVTILSGSGTLTLDGEKARVNRGDSVLIEAGERFQLTNDAKQPLVFEIRPDAPRIWNPDAAFYEISPGQFAIGDQVWFEMIIPT